MAGHPRAPSSRQNPPHFIHNLQSPCHTCRAPAAGWIVNVPVRAGGRPFGGWRNVRRQPEGGGNDRVSAGSPLVPLGINGPSQPPEISLSPVPVRAGRQPGQGWKRACGGPAFGCGVGVDFSTGAPASATKACVRAGAWFKVNVTASVRAVAGSGFRLSDADIIRRISGRARAAPPRACRVQMVSFER